MNDIRVAINIKPLSNNRMWQGRRFKTPEYEAYEEAMLWLLPALPVLEGDVQAEYTFYLKNYAATDVDNLVKPLQDILVKRGYVEDDRRIVRFTARKVKSDVERIEVVLCNFFDVCPLCSGTGRICKKSRWKSVTCGACHGTGKRSVNLTDFAQAS